MPYVCALSEELQEKAARELNEDPETREENIEHIRKWIQEQPHLNIRTDDFLILRFLRGCKFSLEKTKEKIDYHYTSRGNLPEWFTERDPQESKIRELLKMGVMLLLKERDVNGSKVFLFRPDCYDLRKYTLVEATKAMLLLFDAFFEIDEENQINGVGLIIDSKGLTFQHIIHYAPSVVKKGLTMWQEGYVSDNAYWNYIYQGRVLQIMYSILKIFLSEELKRKIKMYDSDLEKMYETVPQRILPNEYGGEGGTIQELADEWLDILDSKREWFREDEKRNSVDESKRPKKH